MATNIAEATMPILADVQLSQEGFLEATDRTYERATAVNLGGDTDTIGFVTGTLAGMYYKMDGIPAEWIDQLANKEMLLTHIDNFIQYYINKDLLEKFGTLDPLDFETSKNHQIMLEERRNKTYK